MIPPRARASFTPSEMRTTSCCVIVLRCCRAEPAVRRRTSIVVGQPNTAVDCAVWSRPDFSSAPHSCIKTPEFKEFVLRGRPSILRATRYALPISTLQPVRWPPRRAEFVTRGAFVTLGETPDSSPVARVVLFATTHHLRRRHCCPRVWALLAARGGWHSKRF